MTGWSFGLMEEWEDCNYSNTLTLHRFNTAAVSFMELNFSPKRRIGIL
jgi:hypothetical protein